ncbi:VanZ family protein [Streptomyces sp. NPDC090053]|uniref:VanZ family protein n=1 Tax=Streptomyces sp. NPDC090053 TaxID=3365932 RepID=UPI00381D6BAC
MDSEPRLQRRTWGSTVMRVLVLLAGFFCMVGFAVALAKVTLEPSAASVDLTHTNLKPGDSIRTYVDQPAFRDTVKQIGGNLLLGVPFGVLLPVLIPKARGLLRVVLVTAFVMFLVESAQGLFITGRAFDIDDVILNTTGALIGYLLLGRRLGRALHPRRTHWWQRSGGVAAAGPPVAESKSKPTPSPKPRSRPKRGPSPKSKLKAVLAGRLKSQPKKSQSKKSQSKSVARKTAAKKASAAKGAAKKSPAKKTPAKKTPAKKTAAKKGAAKPAAGPSSR